MLRRDQKINVYKHKFGRIPWGSLMFYCFRVRRYVRRYFVQIFKFPKDSQHPLENVVSSSVVMCIARPQAVVETTQSQQPIWHNFDNGAT